MINNNLVFFTFTKALADKIGLINAIVYENIQVDFSTESDNDGWLLVDYKMLSEHFSFIETTKFIKALDNLCEFGLLIKGHEFKDDKGNLFSYFKIKD